MESKTKFLGGIIISCIILLTCGHSLAGTVHFQLDPQFKEVLVGETFDLNVMVSSFENEDINSVEFSISFDNNYFNLESFNTDFTLVSPAGFADYGVGSTSIGRGDANIEVGTFTFTALNPVELTAINLIDITLFSSLEPGRDSRIDSNIIASPGLVVSAVPIPGAAWLLGSGLFGFAFIRRRK